MNVRSELNLLISNIVSEKKYSHCRLCLKYNNDGQFTRLKDIVIFTKDNKYLTLTEVLTMILGKDSCEEIPGIDAVCNNCATKAMEILDFKWLYETTTSKLNKVLDSLNSTLDVDIETDTTDKMLCIDCGVGETQLFYMQDNSKRLLPKTALKCANCKESFDDLKTLKEHNEKEHGTYTCGKCLYTSENVDNISEHEVSDQSFMCKTCRQYRCTEESLMQHEVATHGVHVCKECGKSCKGLDKLLAHEEKHNIPEKYVCPKCGKIYLTKDFFFKHVDLCLEDRIELHPNRSEIKKTHFCEECGKGYSAPGGLRVHKRFVHGNAKPHVCNECGKKFTAPCYLKAHMVTHTKERNFPCDICGRKFVSKEALLYHVRRHTGEKPYSCNICNERFVNASARAEHKKFKHGDPTLRCEYCPRMFFTKNFLRIHLRKHQDPTNKLYIGRADVPANMPAEQNMRIRLTYNE